MGFEVSALHFRNSFLGLGLWDEKHYPGCVDLLRRPPKTVRRSGIIEMLKGKTVAKVASTLPWEFSYWNFSL